MINRHKISGFTLLEILVVLSLFVLVLSVSFPLFKQVSIFSDPKDPIVKIGSFIQDFKKQAIFDNQDYFIHIHPGKNFIWVTHGSMDEADIKEAEDKGIFLDPNFSISGIEFSNRNARDNSYWTINISKKGFSDFALIQCSYDQDQMTLKIEPFLFEVQVIDGHTHFEECM